jgi:tRNA G37 N-methylase Trm5
MAKSKLTETKKITHKLATEGELTIIGNIVVLNIPDEGVKNLHELIKNFSGSYVKIAITEEAIEDVIDEESEGEEPDED